MGGTKERKGKEGRLVLSGEGAIFGILISGPLESQDRGKNSPRSNRNLFLASTRMEHGEIA